MSCTVNAGLARYRSRAVCISSLRIFLPVLLGTVCAQIRPGREGFQAVRILIANAKRKEIRFALLRVNPARSSNAKSSRWKGPPDHKNWLR